MLRTEAVSELACLSLEIDVRSMISSTWEDYLIKTNGKETQVSIKSQ